MELSSSFMNFLKAAKHAAFGLFRPREQPICNAISAFGNAPGFMPKECN
jgi:hypothetical protein